MMNRLEGLWVQLEMFGLYLSKCQNLDIKHESLN